MFIYGSNQKILTIRVKPLCKNLSKFRSYESVLDIDYCIFFVSANCFTNCGKNKDIEVASIMLA